MTDLEFISSLKWPIVVLVLAGAATIKLRKKPQFWTWLQGWLDRRNIHAQAFGAQLQTTDAAAPAAAVTAPDAELPDGDAQEIRREAAEQLMRQAAMWGWHAHRVGAPIPVPTIDTMGELPVISFSTESPAQQQSALLRAWYGRHLKG